MGRSLREGSDEIEVEAAGEGAGEHPPAQLGVCGFGISIVLNKGHPPAV